jgi:hypothetical protein
MLAIRLVRLIEAHSSELARDVADRLRHSSRTIAYVQIPEDVLIADVAFVYQHLGDWLMNKTETDIEFRYMQLGMRHAQQGIPISDYVWAIVITKENLWRFLQTHGGVDRVVELYGELELIQLIDQFFDRALYYAMLGYARAEREARAA